MFNPESNVKNLSVSPDDVSYPIPSDDEIDERKIQSHHARWVCRD